MLKNCIFHIHVWASSVIRRWLTIESAAKRDSSRSRPPALDQACTSAWTSASDQHDVCRLGASAVPVQSSAVRSDRLDTSAHVAWSSAHSSSPPLSTVAPSARMQLTPAEIQEISELNDDCWVSFDCCSGISASGGLEEIPTPSQAAVQGDHWQQTACTPCFNDTSSHNPHLNQQHDHPTAHFQPAYIQQALPPSGPVASDWQHAFLGLHFPWRVIVTYLGATEYLSEGTLKLLNVSEAGNEVSH